MAAGRLPREVWALGFVSLFMDVSSEMIQSLLPVFLIAGLGASALTVGLIDGFGEATAAITKVFSGWLSDRLGKRKALAVAGYGLAALCKPAFPLAESVGIVALARFVDRLGKGIRGAPRDALLTDVTPVARRGAAFGLRQSLDTVGAVAGPLLALLLMSAFGGDMRLVFWVAGVPAVLSVLVLLWAVREPPRTAPAAARPPLRVGDLRLLGRRFWLVTALALWLGLARFGEPFLILRAQGLGLPLAWAPAVLVVMNLTYAASAYPAGRLSDRIERRWLFAGGLLVLALSDGVLWAASGVGVALLGAGLWGLHMGLTQGLLSALTADAVPEDLRATAFGVMNMVNGLALLAGGVAAGLLWENIGPGPTYGAAMLAVLPAIALVARRA